MKQRSSPRDVFLHLFAMLSLYWCATGLGSLVFKLIDLSVADPLNRDMNTDEIAGAHGNIRLAIASLVILFPLYLLTSRQLFRDRTVQPEKAHLRVRMWLVHLTLFLAAAILAGDLVVVLHRFLEGELTLPFVLKVATVLLIAGGIFGYYIQDLRVPIERETPIARVFAWGTSALVLAAIVAGVIASGSPMHQRELRLDRMRVADLADIQKEIINYWQHTENLPETLVQLNDPIREFTVPVDPQTDQPYEYRATGALTFELCATFGAESEKDPFAATRRPEDVWDHDAGRHCFQRTIDSKLHMPLAGVSSR